jgi:hypothetical protein
VCAEPSGSATVIKPAHAACADHNAASGAWDDKSLQWTQYGSDKSGNVLRADENNGARPRAPARFALRADGAAVWFEVELPRAYDGTEDAPAPIVSVRGEQLGKDAQAAWMAVVREKMAEAAGASE